LLAATVTAPGVGGDGREDGIGSGADARRETAMKKLKTPESAVLKACLELLTLKRIWHWRQNAGAIPLKDGGYRKFVGLKGIADVLCVLSPQGRLLGIEVKAASGKLRPDQRAFGERLKAAGGLYCVVRNVRELQTFLEANGV
jgi:hypothetical protein